MTVGETLSYTTDVVTWTDVALPAGSGVVYAAAKAGDQWILPTCSNKVISTRDGLTFDPPRFENFVDHRSGSFASSRGVAGLLFRDFNGKVHHSADGGTWTLRRDNHSRTQIAGMAVDPHSNVLVAAVHDQVFLRVSEGAVGKKSGRPRLLLRRLIISRVSSSPPVPRAMSPHLLVGVIGKCVIMRGLGLIT